MGNGSDVNGVEGQSQVKATGLKRKGAEPTVEAMASRAIEIIKSTGDSGSAHGADYIMKTTSKATKQQAVIKEIEKQLKQAGEFDEASISSVITDMEDKLRLTILYSKPAVAKAEAPAVVEAAESTVPSAKVVSVKPTGNQGGDGTPQYTISVSITNLPASATGLSGYIHTNKDWDAGYSDSHGNGTYRFTAYLANDLSSYVIKVKDDSGNVIARIPDSGYLQVKKPR
jgi:hypothetical protein